MLHVVLHALPGTLLFRTWAEARALWDRLVARVRFRVLVLMPTHVHAVLPDAAEYRKLLVAARAFALWRNRQRGESGPVWSRAAAPTPIRGKEHVERTRRYLHLNPCRDGLVADPLAWAFSTSRDSVGFALPPILQAVADPDGEHRWVSSDPSVDPAGTLLPARRSDRDGPPSLTAVFAAVSALTRTPASALRERGPARDLFIAAARALCGAPSAEIAAMVRCHPSTVRHAPALADARLAIIERVLDDPRFPLLDDGDLRLLPSWRKYRDMR